MKRHAFLSVGLVAVGLFALVVVAEERPSSSAAKSPSQSLETLVENVKGAVCKITVRDKYGVAFGQGTGFLIQENRIVSCHHVFEDAAAASVTFPGGQTSEVAGLLADDPAHDLAIAALKTAPAGIQGLSLAELEIPKLGTDVVAVGYPLGLACTVSKGIITSLPTGADFNASVKIKMCPEDMRLVQTDAAISHGNSGGPLVTMDGKVLAVIALQQSKGANLGFGIPTAYLHPMLASATIVKPLAEVKAVASGVTRFKPILPPRAKKVTLEEIMALIGRLNSMIQCRRCRGGGEVMVQTVIRGNDYDSARDRTEKKQCPDCNGRGYNMADKPSAYDVLASMAEPLVYLDTEATAVTPQQATKLVTALYGSLYAVSCSQVPTISVSKAADILRKATGDTPLGVCFPGQVISKISAGDRDYLITRVIGADDVTVALVCKAAKYKLKGSYLISGVIGGRLTTQDKTDKVVFVWPAIIMWPPGASYTLWEDVGILERTYIRKGLFITSERLLDAASKADLTKPGGYIRLP
jgi:hypothetical protein